MLNLVKPIVVLLAVVLLTATHTSTVAAQGPVAVTTYYPPQPVAGYVPVRRGLFGLRRGYLPVVGQTAPAAVTSLRVPVPTVANYAPTQAVTSYYAPAAPVTTYYAPPVTTYYAPAATAPAAPVTSYYAPAESSAPVTTYYAPAETRTTYSAPSAPVTTYYAPSTTVSTAPVTTYYAPSATVSTAPVVTYYPPTVVIPN